MKQKVQMFTHNVSIPSLLFPNQHWAKRYLEKVVQLPSPPHSLTFTSSLPHLHPLSLTFTPSLPPFTSSLPHLHLLTLSPSPPHSLTFTSLPHLYLLTPSPSPPHSLTFIPSLPHSSLPHSPFILTSFSLPLDIGCTWYPSSGWPTENLPLMLYHVTCLAHLHLRDTQLYGCVWEGAQVHTQTQLW